LVDPHRESMATTTCIYVSVMLGFVQLDAQGRKVAWPISDREFSIG
jgi:hypothetical protein